MSTAPLIRGFEVVIGLETHAQLSTLSKIFSGAATQFGAAANTQACAVDLALPGSLPVLNRGAVERAIRFGLGVGATIAPLSIFARKNYFYPDLPKGYQISQYEIPVVQGGHLDITVGQARKRINLTRAHLEEDAGKSLHEDYAGATGIDLNRAGTPLLEIVTEPDMRSSTEAVEYARALHALVVWLGICDGNMQEGSFRCDANVSVRRPGGPLGTRREIKNLNSFRFMQQAIDFEIQWQIDRIEDGLPIEQATVLFNPDSGETRAMRSKEDAHDYRYFPDPDLPPLMISRQWVEEVRQVMPELPGAMAARFVREDGLAEYDAQMMTQSLALAAYYEAARAACGLPKPVANWVMGEISKRLNGEGLEIAAAPVSPAALAALLKRVHDGTISNNAARQVFEALWQGEGQEVDAVIEARGLRQMNDSSALEVIIDDVLAANAKSVEEYRAGKEKAFNALVGQVMKASKGKANPAQAHELLKRKLG
jgi:aspartyl-tRNA(Asn)/glutamyl-tRNA(Gln) amidotransferase subunit B